MAQETEIRVYKTSEKILIWLHRIDQTQIWLAEQMNQSRQTLASKIKDNTFSVADIMNLKRLGCPL
jgi:hypothetical protein